LLKLLAPGTTASGSSSPGVRAERVIDVAEPATAERTAKGLHVDVSDTVFLEEHLGVLKEKGGSGGRRRSPAAPR
jgi:hypothetical protein